MLAFNIIIKICYILLWNWNLDIQRMISIHSLLIFLVRKFSSQAMIRLRLGVLIWVIFSIFLVWSIVNWICRRRFFCLKSSISSCYTIEFETIWNGMLLLISTKNGVQYQYRAQFSDDINKNMPFQIVSNSIV